MNRNILRQQKHALQHVYVSTVLETTKNNFVTNCSMSGQYSFSGVQICALARHERENLVTWSIVSEGRYGEPTKWQHKVLH